jgi:hypothetical protein
VSEKSLIDIGREKILSLAKETRFAPNGIVSRTLLRTANSRLVREWKTMAAMVRCYCQDHHETTAGLCLECRGLLDYATLRLDRCRFGAGKPICAHCPVHCYQRNRRDQVKTVMRYAGPRMLGRHPILSLRHWLDGFRKAPPLNNEAAHAGNF